MAFKRDSVGRDNMEIVLGILEQNGPMTVRDITKAISGYDIGDMQYSFYTRTITTIITKMLKAGHVCKQGLNGRLIAYGFVKPMEAQMRTHSGIPEGKHIVYGYTVDVGSDGLVHEIYDSDGNRIRVYIPASMNKRG